MNKLLTFLTISMMSSIWLSACTTIQYRDGTSEFSRTSFGTNLQITELTASTAPNGDRTIALKGYTSDQVEAIKAAVDGAIKAMAAAK